LFLKSQITFIFTTKLEITVKFESYFSHNCYQRLLKTKVLTTRLTGTFIQMKIDKNFYYKSP